MKRTKLTYELICAAVAGEPQAQEAILGYYEPYINALSTVEETGLDGERICYIDEDLKIEIQMRLLEATKKWKLLCQK